MKIKQQNSHEAIQKVCQLHNRIFHYTSSVAPPSFPELFTKINKLWSERKQDFFYIWLLYCITLYQKR